MKINIKKVIVFICIICFYMINVSNCTERTSNTKINIPEEVQDSLKQFLTEKYQKDSIQHIWGVKIDKLEPIINAMIKVESQGNYQAVGDTHLDIPSYGVLQIRPIMVDDCNQILKKQGSNIRYSHFDAFDKDKSIEMFIIYVDYYVPDYNYEKIARAWNGGPRAIYKNTIQYSKTNNYWNKVKKELYS